MNWVLGMMFDPVVFTFFASWKSEASNTVGVRAETSVGACTGSGKSASPLIGSYAAAPTSTFRYPITSESGSTPAPASSTRAAIVGRPRATRVVSTSICGGVTSFTHERSRYWPGRCWSVKTSLPESTAT